MSIYKYDINTQTNINLIENTKLYDFRLRFSSPRHLVTYLPMVSDYATSISIASCDDVTSKTTISIEDWTKYIYKDISVSTIESVFDSRYFYYFTDDILITDEFVKDDNGNSIPAYKKHTMSKINANSAFILNSDMEKIDTTLYKYDKNNNCIYHNINISNGQIYFVSYNVNGIQILEVLGDEPIYSMLNNTGYTQNGEIDTSKKTYSVAITADGQYYININYNPALSENYDGTYIVTVKPLSSGRPLLVMPSENELTEDWNIDISAKTFIYKDNVYLPIEYYKENESYRPIRPFKLKTLRKCKVVANNVVKTPDDNLAIDLAKEMFITLFIFKSNGVLKHILTTDYSQTEYTGILSNGVRKNFTPNGIINANSNGYIMLSNNIDLNDSDIIYATYYSRSRSFTLNNINLNPYLNYDIKDKKVYIFLNPTPINEIGQELSNETEDYTTTIRYAITDNNGVIVETNINDTENNGFPIFNIATQQLPVVLTTQERNAMEWEMGDIIYNTDEDGLQICTGVAGGGEQEENEWEDYEFSPQTSIIGKNIDDIIFSLSIQWSEILLKYGYTYDGIKNGIQYYTFNNELMRDKLLSGVVFVNIKNTKALYSTIDARSRGGGIKGNKLEQIKSQYKYLHSLNDIGMYDGVPLQDCGLVCASIDANNIDNLGIEGWNKKLRLALSKVLPTGTLIITSNEDHYSYENEEES